MLLLAFIFGCGPSDLNPNATVSWPSETPVPSPTITTTPAPTSTVEIGFSVPLGDVNTVSVVDLDQDGHLDLMGTVGTAVQHSVWLPGPIEANLGTNIPIGVNHSPDHAIDASLYHLSPGIWRVADVDGDGQQDLLSAWGIHPDTATAPNLAPVLDFNENCVHMSPGDLDLDGVRDIYRRCSVPIPSVGYYTYAVHTLWWSSQGPDMPRWQFLTQWTQDADGYYDYLGWLGASAIDDVTGDGLPDLLLGFSDGYDAIYRHTVVDSAHEGISETPIGLADSVDFLTHFDLRDGIGDLDGTGELDVVVGPCAVHTTINGDPAPDATLTITGADVGWIGPDSDGDGRRDLVCGKYKDGGLYVATTPVSAGMDSAPFETLNLSFRPITVLRDVVYEDVDGDGTKDEIFVGAPEPYVVLR